MPLPRTKSSGTNCGRRVGVHRRVPQRGDPLTDLAVGQAGNHLPGGAVDTGPLLFRFSDVAHTMSESRSYPAVLG